MGCNASKPAVEESAKPESGDGHNDNSKQKVDMSLDDNLPAIGEKSDKLYKLLATSQATNDMSLQRENFDKVMEYCKLDPLSAMYQNPSTRSTPLHMAVRLIDSDRSGSVSSSNLPSLIRALIKANTNALAVQDTAGHIPLHYAIAPSTQFHSDCPMMQWNVRAEIVRMLVASDPVTSRAYMRRNDVLFESGDSTGGCTPLYKVIQTLPDDFEPKGPTYQYMVVTSEASPNMSGVGNRAEGDKPLALLYRRFTRQFDISEKFFAGDNSRPEVVEHRRRYKAAAGNTWKIIELLLRPTADEISQATQADQHGPSWRIVHRAVQVETPPDLLRYIVETNPEDLTQVDHKGNSPLHYAAASKPPDRGDAASFPAFYTKYVVDELLYKFPEGAQIKDASGRYPLTLAINSGKQWIGGGIKSLYDAFPSALEQTNLEPHPNLRQILSIMDEKKEEEEDADTTANGGSPRLRDSVIKDEHHDAIMLVQQKDVDVAEVSTSMWAHEEDAGVQMLGCVAIAKMSKGVSKDIILRISLGAVAAVVNAMKAHPNEVIVQEKACLALRLLAQADGKREVSFVASGAVSAIVGAMQAHVGDAGVQEEACGAIAAIVHYGGAERATIVASVSGLTAIVNAIAAHPESVGVQQHGCKALLELTEFSDANLPELHRSQTAPLLEAAKENFPEVCQEAADIVLSRMS